MRPRDGAAGIPGVSAAGPPVGQRALLDGAAGLNGKSGSPRADECRLGPHGALSIDSAAWGYRRRNERFRHTFCCPRPPARPARPST